MIASKIEACLRCIAPELADQPLYVALVGDGLPATYVPGASCAGYHGPRVDVALKPWLGDQWQGRGVCLVIDDVKIAAELAETAGDDRPLFHKLLSQWTLATAVHEAAHALTQAIDLREITPAAEAIEAQLLAAFCLDEAPQMAVPWRHHGADFLRVLLHLSYRASKIGHPLPPSILVSAAHDRLSSVWAYRAALDNEPAELADCTFAEIRATPPPEGFVDLWRQDVWRWYGATLTAAPDPKSFNYAIAERAADIFAVT